MCASWHFTPSTEDRDYRRSRLSYSSSVHTTYKMHIVWRNGVSRRFYVYSDCIFRALFARRYCYLIYRLRHVHVCTDGNTGRPCKTCASTGNRLSEQNKMHKIIYRVTVVYTARNGVQCNIMLKYDFRWFLCCCVYVHIILL